MPFIWIVVGGILLVGGFYFSQRLLGWHPRSKGLVVSKFKSILQDGLAGALSCLGFVGVVIFLYGLALLAGLVK